MPSGTILNVASGVPRHIRGVLDQLVALSRTTISVESDQERMRPSDTPRFVGDARLARRLLGWSPESNFDDTLVGMLEDSRVRVSGSCR